MHKRGLPWLKKTVGKYLKTRDFTFIALILTIMIQKDLSGKSLPLVMQQQGSSREDLPLVPEPVSTE
jgi:hypothetical protein